MLEQWLQALGHSLGTYKLYRSIMFCRLGMLPSVPRLYEAYDALLASSQHCMQEHRLIAEEVTDVLLPSEASRVECPDSFVGGQTGLSEILQTSEYTHALGNGVLGSPGTRVSCSARR